MAVNRGSAIPLYLQISDQLRAEIRAGGYRDGPLPSESALSAEHGVARLTARKAVQLLVAEGLVVVVQGRGAYVKAAA